MKRIHQFNPSVRCHFCPEDETDIRSILQSVIIFVWRMKRLRYESESEDETDMSVSSLPEIWQRIGGWNGYVHFIFRTLGAKSPGSLNSQASISCTAKNWRNLGWPTFFSNSFLATDNDWPRFAYHSDKSSGQVSMKHSSPLMFNWCIFIFFCLCQIQQLRLNTLPFSARRLIPRLFWGAIASNFEDYITFAWKFKQIQIFHAIALMDDARLMKMSQAELPIPFLFPLFFWLKNQLIKKWGEQNRDQFLGISAKFSSGVKYLTICFQVSAYEEQLSHCEPQMNADCRTHPRSSVFIRGLWKLFSQKKSRKIFGWVLIQKSCPSVKLAGQKFSGILCHREQDIPGRIESFSFHKGCRQKFI